jgi:hypothetical protein
MKKLFTLSIILIVSSSATSQFNNSQKQRILSLQNGDFKFFKVSGGETSFETNFRKRYVYRDDEHLNLEADSTKINLLSHSNKAFNLKAGITNLDKFIDLDKLSFEDKGFFVSLSKVYSFTQLVVPNDVGISESQKSSFPLNILNIGLRFGMDNFDRFDPVSQTIEDTKPITASIIGSWTKLIFGDLEKISALSINWQFDLITYDQSEFSSNFKQISGITNFNDDIITFKEFDGKFGSLENNVQRFQIAVSYPFLSSKNPDKDSKLFLTPIPYVSGDLITGGKVFSSKINGKPKATFGFMLGLSTKPIFGKVENYGDDKDEKPIELTIVEEDKSERKISYNNYKYRKFRPPSFIYFGLDNSIQVGTKPELNFFLAGSFSID